MMTESLPCSHLCLTLPDYLAVLENSVKAYRISRRAPVSFSRSFPAFQPLVPPAHLPGFEELKYTHSRALARPLPWEMREVRDEKRETSDKGQKTKGRNHNTPRRFGAIQPNTTVAPTLSDCLKPTTTPEHTYPRVLESLSTTRMARDGKAAPKIPVVFFSSKRKGDLGTT